MKIVMFAGSLRKESLNKKLVEVARQILQGRGDLQIEKIDLQTLNFPVYDGDIEAKGIPEQVRSLGSSIMSADALVISSPEYNGSISSPLKNTIDWVSRLKPVPWEEKPICMLGASPGYFGAIRALGHCRAPFDALGSYLYPKTFALSKASEAFTPSGDLADLKTKEKLEMLLASFLQYVELLRSKKSV